MKKIEPFSIKRIATYLLTFGIGTILKSIGLPGNILILIGVGLLFGHFIAYLFSNNGNSGVKFLFIFFGTTLLVTMIIIKYNTLNSLILVCVSIIISVTFEKYRIKRKNNKIC